LLIVSDVHGAAGALSRVAESSEPLLVLGDLINLIDYRTSEGIVADVVGTGVVKEISSLRARHLRTEANAVWEAATRDRHDEINEAMGQLMIEQYREVCVALEGAQAYVTYGNVDRPDLLEAHLPESAEFVDGQTRVIQGRTVGFAGGGIPQIGTPGEVAPEDMASKLGQLGPVDILCTHVPPDVQPLASDVIGRTRKASKEILDYLLEHQPAFHFFGDIHQPQATTWRVGATTCINVGYFRATGRAVRHG
jgi:Icc-related predicted phosphoesterase